MIDVCQYGLAMFTDISHALVKSIDGHPDAAIGGIFTIGGTLLGLTGGFLLENWRNRGAVRAVPLLMHMAWEGNTMPSNQKLTLDNARQFRFAFELRIFNSFPSSQSLGLESIHFFVEKPGHFSAAKPVLSDPFMMMGSDFQCQGKDDVSISANSFTKLHLSGAAITEETDQTKKALLWKAFTGVQITFVLSPTKRLKFWHRFTPKELSFRNVAI